MRNNPNTNLVHDNPFLNCHKHKVTKPQATGFNLHFQENNQEKRGLMLRIAVEVLYISTNPEPHTLYNDR